MLKLEGFGLFVKDMPTMIRFYRDVLGFEIKEEEQSSNVYLIKDGVLFLLYGRNDFEKMTLRHYDYATHIQGHTELALAVENHKAVDEEYKRLMDLGVQSIMEPKTMPWGQRTFYVADPEGNLIEIGSFNK